MSLPRTTGMSASEKLAGERDRNGPHAVLRDVEPARKGESLPGTQCAPGCPQRIARNAAIGPSDADLQGRQFAWLEAVIDGLTVDEKDRLWAGNVEARGKARHAEGSP